MIPCRWITLYPNYCLYNSYNLGSLEEFIVNIRTDWSCHKDKMFVYNSPLACIHAYSSTIPNITRRFPQGKPLNDSETFLNDIKGKVDLGKFV